MALRPYLVGIYGFEESQLARVRLLLQGLKLPVRLMLLTLDGLADPQQDITIFVTAPHFTRESLARVKVTAPTAPLIVISNDSSQPAAMNAIRWGADDYLCDNRCDAELIDRLAHHLPKGLERCPVVEQSQSGEFGWIGNSVAASRIWATTVKVSPSRSTILIEGQTGVGKDVIALALHRLSDRSSGPLVTMNCAAIPDALIEGELMGYRKGAFTGAVRSYEGKFRLADKGTLFLDEVGELSLAAQAKILRVIESRQVNALGTNDNVAIDVRIVAATNQNLERAVRDGRFRADLYYRLAVVRLNIPTLTERRADIAAISAHLLQQIAADNGQQPPVMSSEMVTALEQYDWPGNVRELRNALEHAFVTAENTAQLTLADLPHHLWQGEAIAPKSESASERQTLIAALVRHAGRKTDVARSLNCSRMTLYRRLERAGLDAATIAATVAGRTVTLSHR